MNTLNVAMFLEDTARSFPDKTFLIAGDFKLTYRQVEVQARRFAKALANLGIQPGERVALLMGNTPNSVICYYGALKLGAIPVSLVPQAPAPEVAYFLTDSGAQALVAFEPLIEAALGGFKEAGTCQHLIIENLPGSTNCPEPAVRLSDFIASADDQITTALTKPEDVAVILYTSGTTGRPKGAEVSHQNIHFLTTYMGNEFWQLGSDDIILMAATLAHIFGQAVLNITAAVRATLTFAPRLDINLFASIIEKDHVTFFAGVPTIAHLLLSSPSIANYNLTSLRKVMLSGAPLSHSVAMNLIDRFKVELITGFGLTEGVPMCYLNAEMFKSAPPGTVGKAAWGTSIRVVDQQGNDVPTGEPGELWIRGPQIFLGYHNKVTGTDEAFAGDWFHTGDVGYVDAQGYYFIVDRLKDMIKVSGFSVYPAEIERVLHNHPAVAEVAVIGVKTEAQDDERVKAFVVLKPGIEVTPRELVAFCRDNLIAYKVPRYVEFLPSLPKGPSGKILKKVLVEKSA